MEVNKDINLNLQRRIIYFVSHTKTKYRNSEKYKLCFIQTTSYYITQNIYIPDIYKIKLLRINGIRITYNARCWNLIAIKTIYIYS